MSVSSISNIAASTALKPPEVSPPKLLDAKRDGDDPCVPQPTVLAALPPGQGTRINQIA
jgi:hypothetical protein